MQRIHKVVAYKLENAIIKIRAVFGYVRFPQSWASMSNSVSEWYFTFFVPCLARINYLRLMWNKLRAIWRFYGSQH